MCVLLLCGPAAVNYVLDKLGYQAGTDEDDEDAQGGGGSKTRTRAEVAMDITEGKHALVDFQVSHHIDLYDQSTHGKRLYSVNYSQTTHILRAFVEWACADRVPMRRA